MTTNVWTNTAPYYPVCLTVVGNNMYASYGNQFIALKGGVLEQINLANPSTTTRVHTYPLPVPPATNSTIPQYLATDNTYIYINIAGNNNNSKISIDRYTIASPNTYITDWYTATSTSQIDSLIVVGSRLFFVSDSDVNNVVKTLLYSIDLTAPTVTATLFATLSVFNFGYISLVKNASLTTDGTYLYTINIVNSLDQTYVTTYISRINTLNADDYLPQWAAVNTFLRPNPYVVLEYTFPFPLYLTVSDGYIYVNIVSELIKLIQGKQTLRSTIARFSLTNPMGDNNLTWQPNIAAVFGLTSDGTYLYTANIFQKTISRFLLSAPAPVPVPVPVSNICFPAGTPIKTDQGVVPIERLVPGTHTIYTQPIEHLTQTVTLDKYLIAFHPSALDYNVPNKLTLLSKDHKIAFKGQHVPAYRFLDYSDKVKKVTYTGEVLYNVLLATHGVMEVNNMFCETLHPANLIAKLYNSEASAGEKTHFISALNNALHTKDVVTYKTLVHKFA